MVTGSPSTLIRKIACNRVSERTGSRIARTTCSKPNRCAEWDYASNHDFLEMPRSYRTLRIQDSQESPRKLLGDSRPASRNEVVFSEAPSPAHGYEHAIRAPFGQSLKALESENRKRGLRLSLVGDRYVNGNATPTPACTSFAKLTRTPPPAEVSESP